MVVHKGRRVLNHGSNWKLYFVKGECPEEACAIEVECQLQNLRSRACFILIKGQKAIIWSGQGLPPHKKAVVESLEKSWPQLATVTDLSRETEGQESETFKAALGAKSDESFHRELSVPTASTRLYQMTSLSGEFHVEEIVCKNLNETVANVMSFNQSDLYKAEQPARFLVEAGNEKLWLWQGWSPDVGHEANDTNMTTGSGIIRWHAERREAMRTIKEFQRSKFSKLTHQTRPPMELVWAAHEPLEFTNLFPSWTPHIDVETLNYIFVGDSSVDRTFALLSRDNYSWEELKQRPLPDGVDPSRLEKYLSDDDFVAHLGLSREDFMAAPRWKQLEIRKEKGLF
jgi:supervillin